MSLIQTPIVDYDHRHSSPKRKFDDDAQNLADFHHSLSAKMRRQEQSSPSSSSSSSSSSNSCSPLPRKVQFFVLLFNETKSLMVEAYAEDTIGWILERIEAVTRVPATEVRLLYGGRQLYVEQTLRECGIERDCNLVMNGRLRSTKHPKAWQVINDIVHNVNCLCSGEARIGAVKYVNELVNGYLSMICRVESDTGCECLQIFLWSFAPVALVRLYLSSYVGNKDCADCCIRQFMSSCRSSSMPKSLHTKCALVVLEFCKRLKCVAPEDDLYECCRSTLGYLLEAASVSYDREGEKEGVLVYDVLNFVPEIANRVLSGLDMSMKDPGVVEPIMSDVQDFAAFLLPLRAGIDKQQAIKTHCSSMSIERLNKLQSHVELADIRLIFSAILQKVDQCLDKMQEVLASRKKEEGNHLYSAWSNYLSILKELYYLSKLYEKAEDEFWWVLRRHRSMLILLITQFAKSFDDHRWILEHKSITNFESRRHLMLLMFPDVKEDYQELHEMLIDRSQLLIESFEYIARAEPESLHNGLFMEFKNEEATGPGVLREWFLLVCQALFNPQNALFVACPNDRRRFYPNPASKVHPLHLDYFTFSGRVIALALMHRVQVGIVLDRVFFKQLAGKNITLEDIQDADPYLYNSCKQMLEMDTDFIDSDALGLTFVREVEELGCRKVVELCPGGKSRVVDSKNREEYVDLLLKDRFVTSISEQVSYFAQGFADILCNAKHQQFFFQSLDLEDFDGMLHGSDSAISVEDWKAHTEYKGYKETDPQISWFWEIVGKMSAEQRRVLLFFWTSLKYLPVEGFKGLSSRLYLDNSMEPNEYLPSSHTCFFRLCLPPYRSFSVMQERIRIITQEHIGCSFGTW